MGSYRSPVSSRTRKGTAATGRSPGSRVIAFARLPEKVYPPFSGIWSIGSPVTVAGTAPDLNRLPFSPRLPEAPVTLLG